MCVFCRTLVGSILIMFIPDSLSKPQQGVTGIPENEAYFLMAIDPDLNPGHSIEIDQASGNPLIQDVANPTINVKRCLRNPTRCLLSSIFQICCEKPRTTPAPIPKPNEAITAEKWSIRNIEGFPEKWCGHRKTEGFGVTITGADDVSQYGEFPWMVAVLTQGQNEYVGGGSLVHLDVVLTAAHKVHGKSGLVARIGDWNLSDKNNEELIAAQTINVKEVVFHPNFSRQTLVNDVALLILESDAVLGHTVMPICLPDPNQDYDRTDCTVTGWGSLSRTGMFQRGTHHYQNHYQVLRKVNVPAVNHSTCQGMLQNTRLGQNFTLHSSFNCAGGDGKDSCVADGGSPLICPKSNNPTEYVQMGITAWGIGCGVKGKPGVYGSVPKTVDWIKEVMNGKSGINAI